MRRVILVVGMMAAAPAIAAEYGGESDGLTADELAALAAAGELDAEGLDALLSLRDEPPDAARASAEELALLPGVGRAEARRRAGAEVGGASVALSPIRLDAGGIAHPEVSPEGFARLRLAPTSYLTASALVLARARTRFGASAEELVSDGPRREVGLERWHAGVTLGAWRLVVGNYNCNFGDSLTFSSARRPYAAAVTPADAVIRAADARSIRAAGALRGLAIHLDAGMAELTAFASYRSLDLYQYGEWVRVDRSPSVLLRATGEPLRYATLADAARESLGGINVDVRVGEQLVGATAYLGTARLTDAEGAWSSSSVYPPTPRFGATGLHLVTQIGPVRGRGEVARTLEGGIGAIARVDVALGQDCDVGLTGRYYAIGFDNPFTRSMAAPDEMEGARARDERGVELATALAIAGLVHVGASVDVWTALTAPSVVNGRARARTTWQVTSDEALVIEGDCVDKDLAHAGVYAGDSCARVQDDCARGARASATARLVSERIAGTRVAVGGRHTRLDAARGVAAESRVTAHVTVQPLPALAIGVVASERLTVRAVEIDGGKRLVALSVVGRIGDWASLEITARGEQRWDAALEAESMTFAGALTLMVRR